MLLIDNTIRLKSDVAASLVAADGSQTERKRMNTSTRGMIGSGGMARSFPQAIEEARPMPRIRTFSRSAENRQPCAAPMQAEFGVEIIPVDAPADAVRGADIVTTRTDSIGPEPEWLGSGTHVATLRPCAGDRMVPPGHPQLSSSTTAQEMHP